MTDATGISATESFLVTVNPVNDLPTLSTVANVNVQEDATIAPITLTIGDVETSLNGLTLSATSDNQAVISNSGLVLSGSGATRTLTIAQVPNASGTANITLTLTDADGGTATRKFAVNIADANDAPIAANLTANVLEGGIVTVNLGAAATDAEGQVNVGSIVITQQPARGDVTINTTTGVVTYSHDDSETTSDSFSYTIKDAQGLVSAVATVNLTVQPVNDAPVVADETLSINSNVTTAITINVLANDTDPDGPNTLTVSSVIGGTVGQSFMGTYGMIMLSANGTLSFTLDPDAVDGLFSGSQVEELIAYEVSDGLTSSFGVLEIDIDII